MTAGRDYESPRPRLAELLQSTSLRPVELRLRRYLIGTIPRPALACSDARELPYIRLYLPRTLFLGSFRLSLHGALLP